MKKLVMYLSLILMLIFTGCAKNTNTPTNPKSNGDNTKQYTISDYYPFKENIQMIYEGKGNEYASQDIMTDFIKDNLIQIRIDNGGTVMGRLIENKNGELTVLYNKEEFYYKDDLSTLDISSSTNREILLKEPLVVGTSWTLPDGSKRTITSTSVSVATPAGTYTALEVTTEGSNFKTKDYYALNIGFVKSVFTSENFEVSTTLKEIVSNASLRQSLQLFYPQASQNDIKVVYTKADVTLKTNEEIKNVFEQYFKNPPKENLNPLVSANAKINKLYLDSSKNMIMIDFSKEFITEMNAGSGTENAILNSIINTLGNYYNADKVYITVDSAPYESGHIIMDKNNGFTVDFKNSTELK